MKLEQKPLVSPFGAKSLASDVVSGVDLRGKTAIVTGGASGLGTETVRALAKSGATVVMPVRRPETAAEVAAEIVVSTGNRAIELAFMDLGDYPSVGEFADAFVSSGRKLDILINNAGIMATPERRIMGSIEAQFGTNHLGHMLLTCRLAPAFAEGARVVSLSSLGHRRSAIRFEDPNFERSPYDKWEAYGQSKTANALFAVELHRRLDAKGMSAFAAHPGGIMTNLQRDLSHGEIKTFGWVDADGRVKDGFKTPAGGAATAVWCAISPILHGRGGVYCEDCNVAVVAEAGDSRPYGVRPWAIDPGAASRLWSLSEELIGQTFDV